MRALADGRIMSVLHDVTTTVADADQLRDSREQLLFAANALPALIAYVDNDARYVWGNAAYHRWFGYSPEELVGRHVSEVLGTAAWSTIRDHIERVLGGDEVSFDSKMIYSHGPARDVRASYVPHRDASGRVRGFVGLVNDVSEMRRAEQALQHIERMLAESQAAAHVGSWEATFNKGDHVEPDSLLWSDENYRIFGYEPGSVEVNHRLFVASIHPDDRQATRATTEAGRRRGGRFEKEFRIVRPDGTVRMIHAWTSVEPGTDGKPTRLLGTCQDITERRLAEQEVRQAREQLQLVVDSTPAIIARGDRERRLVWTNKRNAARFGKTPEDLVGKPLREIIGEEAYHVVEGHLDRVLRDGETVEFEGELYYTSLGQRSIQMVIAPTFDPAGAPDGWVAVITDNTNRHALEQALRLSEERYRSLVGIITSVVWTANATGEIVEPQPTWEGYTGQTWAQYQARGWVDAIHPDDRGQIAAGLGEAMSTGSFERVPMRLWHAASNDFRFCETGGVAIRNPDGSIREWIGTMVDVHERELALRALKEADRRKDEFLAMLSHELRNPLAPILSAVEILRLVDQRDAEMSATYRNVIAQQVQHMKRLLDDLLDVSRVSQGKIELRREALDLGAILLQAVDVSRPLITEKKQQLSVTKPPAPVLVEADPTRLVQVFANLLNNAAKYADHGGHIALEMSADGGEALVRVRDDGVGMSPDLLETAPSISSCRRPVRSTARKAGWVSA